MDNAFTQFFDFLFNGWSDLFDKLAEVSSFIGFLFSLFPKEFRVFLFIIVGLVIMGYFGRNLSND